MTLILICDILIRQDEDSGLFFVYKTLSIKLWYERATASGGNKMRVRVTLACTDCKQRNYNVTKEKKNHPERMETRKYCRFCRKHTMHKETK